MLFPQLAPQYYEEKHRAILSKMEAFYAESITINQSFWGEADTDTRFYMGDQTLWNDVYGNMPANRRKQLTFNRIRPIINMISGYQRDHRKSMVAVGVENADNDTADQFTKILMWVCQQENVLETISESFEGSLVTGMNLLHIWVDYRSDPVSGNIRVDNCSYNSFLIDPYFRKADLSDCNGIWKRSYLTKRDCISLMPDHADDILALQGSDSGNGKDGKFQFMPENYNYGMKNLLTYDEFWYRDYRTQQMLVDSQTGETIEWKSQDEDRLKEFMAQNPTITMVEQEIQTVKLVIVIQGKVFYHDRNPNGTDTYPFVPVFSYYQPQMPYFPTRIQGVVRDLRDPQYLYNRFLINMADILESQVNSGYIYKENALVNPKDIFFQGNGKGIALKEEAQMTDIVKIQPGEAGSSFFQLANIFSEEMFKVSGVNEENMGSAVDDKAGILAMLRQGAGLTVLRGLFDNLDRAQRLLGQKMIDIVQANFMPGKIQSILEAQPSQQFYNKLFGRYGIVIEDGLNTATQKQMNFAQLVQLKELLGDAIPNDLLIEQSTIQEKKKLVEAMQKVQQQQAQAQQAQMELQARNTEAQINLAQARAKADEGLGYERISRIEENAALAVERRAAAVKDEDIGLLNLIKALKEIDGVDIDHIEKLMRLSSMMKEQNAATSSASSANATGQVRGTNLAAPESGLQ